MYPRHIQTIGGLMVEAILAGADTQEAIASSIREKLSPLTVTDHEIGDAAAFVMDAIEHVNERKAREEAEASNGR